MYTATHKEIEIVAAEMLKAGFDLAYNQSTFSGVFEEALTKNWKEYTELLRLAGVKSWFPIYEE